MSHAPNSVVWSLNLNVVISVDLDEYLNEKYLSLHKKFLQTNHLLSKRDSSNIVVENVKENKFPEVNNFVKIFTALNKTLLLSKDNLYEINNHPTKLILVSQNTSLEKISDVEKITYTKDIMFGNVSFIISKSELMGEVYVYISSRDKYSLIQTLFVPDSTDAHFFINNQNLYLMVANNKGDNLAVTSIYKWLGFHFDEIQTVFTTGAIKVGSFTTLTAEVIIILQDISNRTVPSFVFEFANDEIRKIQHLFTVKPIHLDIYTSKNRIFTIIYSRSKNNTVYYWDGFDLNPLNEFATETVIYKTAVVKVNDSAIIATPFNGKLQIYSFLFGANIIKEHQHYSSNISNILDVCKGLNENLYITGLSDNDTIVVNTFSIKLDTQEKYNIKLEKDKLRKCFLDLEIKVNTIDKENAPINLDQKEEEILTQSLVKEPEVETIIKKLKNKLIRLFSMVKNYTCPDPDNLIVNGNLTVTGNIMAKTLIGTSTVIQNINGQRWAPERWLKYKEPQTITGRTKFRELIIEHLETTSHDKIFNGLILKTANQKFSQSVNIGYLIANRLFVKIINDVLMDEVYVKSKPQKITGKKTFKALNVAAAQTTLLNEKEPETILSDSNLTNFEFDHVKIKNLEIENINGVPWDNFKNSVFRNKIDTEIKGSLDFISIKAARINVPKLKDINVSTLFTKSTDQNITANVEMKDIIAGTITAETINKLEFTKKTLPLVNETEFIPDLVTFITAIVQQNLNLTGDLDKSLYIIKDDHLLGTKESDLMQIYSGKVTINGDLFLKELDLLPQTKLIVSDTEVNYNLTDVYWSKNTQQEIPVNVKFQSKLSVEHLLTKKINGVEFGRYCLNNNDKKIHSDFKFKNIRVLGNIILRDSAKHQPDLKKVMKEVVNKTGGQTIHIKKHYMDTLKVEILQTGEIGGIDLSQMLNNKSQKNITGTKTIKNLIVEYDATSIFKDVETINNNSLKALREKFIFTDQSYNFSGLDFRSINVTNLHVKYINSRSVDEYNVFKKIVNKTVINNLTIHGNVSLDHIKNLKSLNNISYEDIKKNISYIGQQGILNDVKFTTKIKVNNLIAEYINNIALSILTKKVFTKHTNQNITAPFNFKNIRSDNLITPWINNIFVEGLVNTGSSVSQKIFSPNGTVFSNLKLKSLKALRFEPCNVETIKRELADPPTQEWSEVEIKGNVTLLDDTSLLYRIFEKAVKLSSPNVIHCTVNISASVLMKNLITTKLINGVNIPELLEDAILSESDKPQFINGIKWFLTLRTKNALVLNNLDAAYVNGEDIMILNETIVDKNEKNKVIKGMKTFFAGLQTNQLNSKHISNIQPEKLVNLQKHYMIPEATFDQLEVKNNLNINFYDSFNFTDVIDNRLVIDEEITQTASGIYYFKDLEVFNLITPVINDINIDNIVFDVGIQSISSIKHFTKPVSITGKTSINFINSVNLTDRFKMAIPFDGPVNMNGSVTVLKSTISNGTINTESINGHSVTLIKKILSASDEQLQTEEIFNAKTELTKKIKKTIPFIQRLPMEFLYLEKSNELQLTVPNAVRASTTTSNDYVLIHVNGHESGVYCGLPINCTCPSQYTIEISPHYSVSILPNKSSQRIFSYDDGKCTITFMTNSVSTSSTCRTSKTKLLSEISMMTWITKSNNNVTGVIYQYNKFFIGYVSKVEFFTLHGKTYVLVGRYYEPVIDTYDLDCIVLQFNENRTYVREIQRIHTRGGQEVFLIQTAQGVVLVLGNKIPSDIHHELEETMIYRFNPDKEEFIFLRTVPSFGCSMATGIVVGTDSLIALAHTEAPVQILKYYPEFDDYYFYQSFPLEDQVIGISSFYTGAFGISEAYLSLVTSSDRYYIYSYKFLEGFKLKSIGELEGLRNLIPLQLKKQIYLFAPSSKNSALLSVVKSGSN